MAALGIAAITIALNDQNYRYDRGVYYSPYNGGYRVVAAPAGIFLRSLPNGYTTVNLEDFTCYYFAGTFYTSSNGGYTVITAPPGAIVYDLPDGCTELRVGDIDYLRYNNAVFQSVLVNGENAYEVVDLRSDN